MSRSNLKLQAKFNTPQEVVAVQEVARYLNLSEKQFLRIAALRAVQQVSAEVRAQAAQQQQQQQQAEEIQNGGESSNLQPESAHEEGQSSEVVGATTPS